MPNLEVKRIVVFSLTFLSYALYHAARKTLSGVKSSISNDWIDGRYHEPLFPDDPSAQTFLGTLDAIFMICYAGALVFWGWLGDRLNPLNVVVFGMVGSAIFLTLFGTLPYYLNFYSVPWYVSTYAIFGVVQACGFPNEVAIMANWFPEHNRGFVMGMWAACQPLGNIFGSLLISLILPMGYQITFALNSLIVLIGAGILLIFVTPKPQVEHRSDAGSITSERAYLLAADNHRDDDHRRLLDRHPLSNDDVNDRNSRPVSVFEALCLPSVLPYCMCNACLKFVNYAFFFWLPFYLTYRYGWPESEANRLAIWYDVGGIFGSVLGGIASDRLGHRCPILMVLLIASLPLLFVYAGLGPVSLLHVLFMTLLGITISGPYNLIVGTIAIDLGSQPALVGNTDAMSTVTGLIDGTGSTGSAIGQLFVPVIQNKIGWVWVFYLFILMNTLSALCLMRRFIQDVRIIWRSKVISYQLHHNSSGSSSSTSSNGRGNNSDTEALISGSSRAHDA